MARSVVALCLVAVLALTYAYSAEATLGKGKMMGKGKGISFETQCTEVCKPKCRLVARPVCAEIQVPYQDCDKVPFTTTVQKCAKVCQAVSAPVVIPTGKGKAFSGKSFGGYGKGRHLLTLGKGKMMMGKGKAAPVSIDCQPVCQDVPITSWRTQCTTKTRTATTCKKDFDQVCEQKCRPVCTKVPVMVEAQPVVYSKGKGKGGWGH